jgi:hypothetical protein
MTKWCYLLGMALLAACGDVGTSSETDNSDTSVVSPEGAFEVENTGPKGMADDLTSEVVHMGPPRLSAEIAAKYNHSTNEVK